MHSENSDLIIANKVRETNTIFIAAIDETDPLYLHHRTMFMIILNNIQMQQTCFLIKPKCKHKTQQNKIVGATDLNTGLHM